MQQNKVGAELVRKSQILLILYGEGKNDRTHCQVSEEYVKKKGGGSQE